MECHDSILKITPYDEFLSEAFDDLSHMLSNCRGIRVVGKRSWKKREVGKSNVGKILIKLKRAYRS